MRCETTQFAVAATSQHDLLASDQSQRSRTGSLSSFDVIGQVEMRSDETRDGMCDAVVAMVVGGLALW